MEQMNFHKQKLYALIGAALGFISLLLPWRTIPIFGSVGNGFNGVGIIALLGVIGVAIAIFMGDKTKDFDDNSKKIAMGSFAAMALAGILTFVTKYHGASTSAGMGAWLSIIVGVGGLLFLLGIIKVPDTKKPPTS